MRKRRRDSRYSTRAWQGLRKLALDRDGWRCQQCGKAGRLEVDHVVAVRDGGEFWQLSNLQSLCRRCHLKKTRREQPEPPRPETAAGRAWDRLIRELTDDRP